MRHCSLVSSRDADPEPGRSGGLVVSAAPIVVGGEALYDLVAGPGDEAATLTGHAGGGPFNVARTIGRLRRPVAFLGRLSTDRLGATHARMLAEDGVGLQCVVRTDDPTTLALASLDEDGDRELRLLHRRDGRGRADGRRRRWRRCRARVAALHVGTLGLVLEPLASAMEAVAERLAGTHDGRRRPQLPAAGDLRSGGRTASGWPASSRYSDLVKASEEDLAWLRSRPARRSTRRARCCEQRPARGAAHARRRRRDRAQRRRRDGGRAPCPRTSPTRSARATRSAAGWLAWWVSRGLGAAQLDAPRPRRRGGALRRRRRGAHGRAARRVAAAAAGVRQRPRRWTSADL